MRLMKIKLDMLILCYTLLILSALIAIVAFVLNFFRAIF
jgi:hypothetical protein